MSGKRHSTRYENITLATGELVHDNLWDININVLQKICSPILGVPIRQVKTRIAAYEKIAAGSAEAQVAIQAGAAITRLTSATSKQPNPPVDQSEERSTTQAPILETNLNAEETARLGTFMNPPSDDEANKIIKKFIRQTGNAYVRQKTCASCARESFATETKIVALPVLPNKGLLAPETPHPAHRLTRGLLLEESAVTTLEDGGGELITICHQCHASLMKNKRPQLALSNNMWIGPIPEQLSSLTIAERILISKYFPFAYVYKLYPKKAGSRKWMGSSCYQGMKGNVSTYRMDPALVADIVGCRTMPPPPKVLATVIGVTFVGPNGLKDGKMPGFFYVRRSKVAMALEWLKENNPLYSDIVIDADRLQQLPVNGVPREILAVARSSDDIEAMLGEQANYVPQEANEAEDGDEVEIDASFVPDGMGQGVDYNGDGMDIDVQGASDGSEKEINYVADSIDDAMRQFGYTDDMEENVMSGNTNAEPAPGPGITPSIVPIQALGVVDVAGSQITDSELLAHALANTANVDSVEYLRVQRGNQYVNEYGRADPETAQPTAGTPTDPNHLLGSFPVLFPYGQGGFETQRPIKVTYESHAKWALEYHDKRFRLDLRFMFQIWGVMQKRQICRSAVLQIKREGYQQYKNAIAHLKPEDLLKAAEQEAKKHHISNPTVNALRRFIEGTRAMVPATDESRRAVRCKIWGMILLFNAPSLWITINPADIQDPIAQVLAGSQIDLDAFVRTQGGTQAERSARITQDPVAAAKFFAFIISTILVVVVGLRKSQGCKPIERTTGAFGKVQGYVGTVETQGRGTLHLHMLVWLADTPSTTEIRRALQTEAFRKRVADYIDKVVKADIDGLSHEDIIKIPHPPAVSYSRPVDPTTNLEQSAKDERTLARALQLHTCSTTTCLKSRKGKLVCKRHAPWAKALQAWVDFMGRWGPKRFDENMNAWNAILLICARCNCDIKILTNGGETCVIVLYVTNYATKTIEHCHNKCALLAKRLAFHRRNTTIAGDLVDSNRLMLQRCCTALLQEREFSGPEVATYILGYNDTYESHHFVPIYWSAALGALKQAYPGLVPKRPRWCNDGAEEERPTEILRMVAGEVQLRNQLKDYRYRGTILESSSFLDFNLNTYEVNSTERGPSVRGRKPNTRAPYLLEAKRPGRTRVVRSAGHETVPRFVGPWFPRSTDGHCRELYCASMLLLLRPWRSFSDLKSNEQTFDDAFQVWSQSQAENGQIKRIISNIDYYHECWDLAARKRDTERAGGTFDFFDYEQREDAGVEEDYFDLYDDVQIEDDSNISDEAIEEAKMQQFSPKDLLFAEMAMDQARWVGIFPAPEDDSIQPIWKQTARKMVSDELEVFERWHAILTNTTSKHMEDDESADSMFLTSSPVNTPICLPNVTTETRQASSSALTPVVLQKERVLYGLLNRGQRKAHDILEQRLLRQMQGDEIKPLRMIVHGHGGVGKSMLIQALTETFQYHERSEDLAKTGTSGVAACGIHGKTLHSWLGLGVAIPDGDNWMDNAHPSIKERRLNNIGPTTTVFVDEMSMITHTMLALMACICQHVKQTMCNVKNADDFGNMNVVLFGDFHQFPPVSNPTAALYCSPNRENALAMQGRALFETFESVVFLEEQMRTTDEVWANLLTRLREGECTDDDLAVVDQVTLSNPACVTPDFTSAPWKDAILVTSRHTVRNAWNAAALRRHCTATGQTLYRCPAADTFKTNGQPLDKPTRLAVASLKQKRTGRLSSDIEIAVGMKCMVVFNLATENDIANGTRGVIVDIVLDENEPPLVRNKDGTVNLIYPPAMILFQPDLGCDVQFPGNDDLGIPALPTGVVPLFPSSNGFTVTTRNGSKVKVVRTQYAITGGYAFTDYKSQGQTLIPVLLDMADPPSGRLSPFSAYVCLSRSRGRDWIRLIRPIPPRILQTHPSLELKADMQRLRAFAASTV